MPDVIEYERGFGLSIGLTFGNYKMVNMRVDHKEVVKWNEYSYPSMFLFTWIGTGSPNQNSMNELFRLFTEHTKGIRIIHSASGRSYKCAIQWPLDSSPKAIHTEDYREVDLHYDGYAKRIGAKEAKEIADGTKGW